MIRNILTVCTGNICRSPMAEALLQSGLPELQVSSAGTGALVGYPADPIVLDLMSQQGLDVSSHRARQLTAELGAAADLILVLDHSHREWVSRQLPQLFGRTHLLLAWDDARDEVPDPYRQSRAVFEQSLELIRRGVEGWRERIGAL